MRLFLTDKSSLRTRLVFGILIMLLPICIFTSGSFLTFRSAVNTLETVIYDPVERLSLLSELQKTIHKVRGPVHQFAIYHEHAERVNFNQFNVEINLGFDELASVGEFNDREIGLLTTAKHEWINLNAVAQQILTSQKGSEALFQPLLTFDQGLDRTLALIDQAESLTLANIQAKRLTAQRVQWQSIVYAVIIFGLGLFLATVGSFVLYRIVIAPIRSIEQTVDRFGKGDLHSRVSLSSDDELGHLATAFNAMAERFQRVQSELDYLSIHDNLTGLYDRPKFHEIVNMEMMRAKRYERPFSLLFIDINNFKEVNERYGRLVGDSVLCSVAMQINNAIRPTDMAARYGGDEFAVILSETPQAGAKDTAERIGFAIAASPLNIGDGKTLQITVAIGVTTYPYDADNEPALFLMTEQALEQAKKVKSQNKFSLVLGHS